MASAFQPVSGLPLAGASSWPTGVTQLHAGGLPRRSLNTSASLAMSSAMRRGLISRWVRGDEIRTVIYTSCLFKLRVAGIHVATWGPLTVAPGDHAQPAPAVSRRPNPMPGPSKIETIHSPVSAKRPRWLAPTLRLNEQLSQNSKTPRHYDRFTSSGNLAMLAGPPIVQREATSKMRVGRFPRKPLK